MSHSHLIENLVPAAYAAGDAIMEVYQRGVIVEAKGDGSPVTEADKRAEAIIISVLEKEFPDITVISEENAETHSIVPPETFFLVDPLDGTREFVKQNGKGEFTVNIALIENGVPSVGIVYAPATNRMFTGSSTAGAFENDRAIKTRTVPESGAVAVASASHRDEKTNQWLEQHSIRHTVSVGSSLKFCLTAAGEADLYPRFSPTMEWDTAAGDAVLRAAGGMVENLDGSSFVYGKTGYRNGAFVAKGKM